VRRVILTAILLAILAALPQPVSAQSVHVIEPGDTLWDLSRRYGTSVEALAALNQLDDPNYIRAGDDLLLPLLVRVEPSERGGRAGIEADHGELIVEIAREYLGYPYVWGGLTPSSGFDCAGYVTWVYAQTGISLQTTWIDAYWQRYPRIERGDWRPGDLVILANTYKVGISHVAIYAGGGRMLHAVAPGVGVAETGIYGYGSIVGAVRPW
jgi:peptidoglycan DL-endopeptidase LytE